MDLWHPTPVIDAENAYGLLYIANEHACKVFKTI